MNYATIKKVDIANGPGVRVSLFVSGCHFHCKECFNDIAWDFNYGELFTNNTIDEIIEALSPDHIQGLTLLGGEPMEKVNQEGLLPLLQVVKEKLPSKDIWAFTGYIYDDLLPGGQAYYDVTDELLSYIDVLVDGQFILEKKNIRLRFRGSENQRLIDLKQSRKSEKIVLWDK
ncbi:MAG: anaerobic ribonucleoside-triphosphate reductase activating protein [Erysipelotrichaceae bacterium]|nr:anaerobic ribonucleoside-triphosphate reductase activating protein [Erysipelotrichaceae bacterium]